MAYFNILTPEKGTMFYERMKNEDRILKLNEIGRWPGNTCYIKPRYCTPEEMVNKVQHIYRESYSWMTQANIASWVLNLSQRKMAQFSDEVNNNFDAFLRLAALPTQH